MGWDWNDDEDFEEPRMGKKAINYKLDLHAPVQQTEQSNATIPVAWCFKPDSPLRALFEAERWINPHLLLVVSTEDDKGKWTDSAVYIAKITEALKYVSFRRPGRNRVRAVIVDVDTKNENAAAWAYSHRKRFEEGYSLADPSLAKYDSIGLGEFNKKIYDERAEFFVNVPVEMFAKPPTGFKKAILTYWFDPRKKLVDACDSRRKAWVIGTPAWLVTLPAMYALKTLFLLGALLVGSRLFKEKRVYLNFLNPLAPPWRMMSEVYDESSIYIRPKNKDGDMPDDYMEESVPKGVAILLSNPAIWLVPGTIWYAIGSIHHTVTVGTGESKHKVVEPVSSWGYWETVLRVDLGIFALLLLFATALTLAYALFEVKIVNKALATLSSALSRKPLTAEEREKERREMLDRLALLACGPDGAPMAVGDLPRELRTLSLRYNELKTKVCKPFAA